MYKNSTDAAQLKHAFWEKLTHSPFVMLELDADPESAAPMTAQLDKHADSAIWFFTTRSGRFAPGGAATANFSAKGHHLFARFSGTLTEETDRAVFDKHWSKPVEAWYPEGKDSPDILFLRMDLGSASIWLSELGVTGTIKMLLGMDVRDDAGRQVETAL